jgi:glycosyltransferase involved in cell wall biosynthesis
MNARRLLMLHDSPQFGGHEVMLLNLLPGVIEGGGFDEIVACFPATNRRLADGLAALGPSIRLQPWDFVKRRAEPYLGFARRDYAAAVRGIVAAEQPLSILLVQGRIENLAVPMMAIPDDRFVVSYVPMAHLLADMGRRGWIGDAVRRRLYRRPDRFIVPSHSVARQVAVAGGGPAIVVENFVAVPTAIDRAEARRALDLPADRRIALFMGRLDTAQKGLDTLIAAMRRQGAGMRDWLFLFVGDGEGRAMLDALANDPARGFDMRLLPWTDRPEMALAAADIMLMPSRWEGVPLVMLEAMACNLPILTSDIDVFREYLPPECIADFATADLAERMAWLASAEGRAWFTRAVTAPMTQPVRERARAQFAAALLPPGHENMAVPQPALAKRVPA